MPSKTIVTARAVVGASIDGPDIMLRAAAPGWHSWRAAKLTPHRARELGKALIQMADEKEGA